MPVHDIEPRPQRIINTYLSRIFSVAPAQGSACMFKNVKHRHEQMDGILNKKMIMVLISTSQRVGRGGIDFNRMCQFKMRKPSTQSQM